MQDGESNLVVRVIRTAWRMLPELPVLLAVLAIVAMAWGFVELTDAVLEGQTQHFDQRVAGALRRTDRPGVPQGPQWLAGAGRDVTALGSVPVLSLMTAAVAIYLLLRGKHRAMWLMLLAVISGAVLSTALKQYIARPRPPGGSDLTQVFSYSFPSGHSMLSAVVYLVLGVMLAGAETRRRIKIYFLATAMLLTFMIGCSRVYLGVHYPSDVLGGWTAGLSWALMWWLIARWLTVRQSPPDRIAGLPVGGGRPRSSPN
jgi:undecaprenyl-diphosphatase